VAALISAGILILRYWRPVWEWLRGNIRQANIQIGRLWIRYRPQDRPPVQFNWRGYDPEEGERVPQLQAPPGNAPREPQEPIYVNVHHVQDLIYANVPQNAVEEHFYDAVEEEPPLQASPLRRSQRTRFPNTRLRDYILN